MAHFTENFVRTLLQLLFDDAATSIAPDPPVIKRHTDNLDATGDFSFPLDVQSWRHVLSQAPPPKVRTIFGLRAPNEDDNGAEASADDVIESPLVQRRLAALRLSLAASVDRIVAADGRRVALHLNRTLAFECLPGILRAGAAYGRVDKVPELRCSIREVPAAEADAQRQTITEYRCELLRRVLRNLIEYSKYTLCEDGGDGGGDGALVVLSVSHKSTDNATLALPGVRNVICGVVKEVQSGHKMSDMLAGEYLRIRQTHMELMAQHKYGLRWRDNAAFAELSRTLGRAAVSVDLLEVRHSSPVRLNVQQHTGGASRGAAFVLYQSARIEKLLAMYGEQVANGSYEPDADAAAGCDWRTLLTQPEEWQLMFDYVLEFPSVVRRALGNVEGGAVAPHLVCAFLNGLARCFSVYYRRVRILDHPRKHLMARMHCRMRLVLAVRGVLNQALALLDIEPVQNM